MSTSDFADIVIEEKAAREELAGDPLNPQKFDRWVLAFRNHRVALGIRQRASYAERYPCVQFERVSDMPELDPDAVDMQTPPVSEWQDERNSRPEPY